MLQCKCRRCHREGHAKEWAPRASGFECDLTWIGLAWLGFVGLVSGLHDKLRSQQRPTQVGGGGRRGEAAVALVKKTIARLSKSTHATGSRAPASAHSRSRLALWSWPCLSASVPLRSLPPSRPLQSSAAAILSPPPPNFPFPSPAFRLSRLSALPLIFSSARPKSGSRPQSPPLIDAQPPPPSPFLPPVRTTIPSPCLLLTTGIILALTSIFHLAISTTGLASRIHTARLARTHSNRLYIRSSAWPNPTHTACTARP